MHTQSVIFCAISTIIKNYLSKKKGCQSIFFFLEESLKVSAKCNSFKHFSVFTLFSLSHPKDQQLLYQKTNVSIKRVLKWNQKSKINVIHIYESVFRLRQSGEHLEWERGTVMAHGGEVDGYRFIPEHGEVALL